METSDLIWGGLLLAGAAYEAWALVNKRTGDTLSETTRSVFRVRTSRVGRWTFGILWASFALWFFFHILYGWPAFPGL